LELLEPRGFLSFSDSFAKLKLTNLLTFSLDLSQSKNNRLFIHDGLGAVLLEGFNKGGRICGYFFTLINNNFLSFLSFQEAIIRSTVFIFRHGN